MSAGKQPGKAAGREGSASGMRKDEAVRDAGRAEKLRVAMAASEAIPFGKAGGLGDAVPALAQALARQGAQVRLFLPYYRKKVGGGIAVKRSPLGEARVRLGPEEVRASFHEGRLARPGVEVVLVGSERFFDREGIYDDPATGKGYPDNGLRFAFFQRAVAEALRAGDFRPDVVHAHDNQCALLPLLLQHDPGHPDRNAATVLTIHNLGYQGIYGMELLPFLGLPGWLARPMAPLEYYGSLSFLKGGIVACDRLTTVSPRYSREVLTPELGCGLEGVLRERQREFSGILNGVDYEQWDPRHDAHLPARYSAEALEGKRACRDQLLEQVGLAPAGPGTMVLGFVGRLTGQKGLDLVAGMADRLLEADVRLVLLGTGEKEIEERLTAAAGRHTGKMTAELRFDEALAHRITAGADLLLMPSRYEPCGLNQLYALRYGTLPIVRETGGLADTVRDLDEDPERGNGFLFLEERPRALLGTAFRAMDLRTRKPDVWRDAVRRAMAEDFSWDRAALAYREVFEAARRGRGVVRP